MGDCASPVLTSVLCMGRLFTGFLLLFPPQFIPMPVLYGVFLYMGVASLNGVQVSPPKAWERPSPEDGHHEPARGFTALQPLPSPSPPLLPSRGEGSDSSQILPNTKGSDLLSSPVGTGGCFVKTWSPSFTLLSDPEGSVFWHRPRVCSRVVRVLCWDVCRRLKEHWSGNIGVCQGREAKPPFFVIEEILRKEPFSQHSIFNLP